tara:strand:- start:530 stop:931 length:402 start_codon:yes stop_codon:yes gene_type:complete
MNRQDFNQMMKDSFGDKVVNIPSKTDNELIADFMGIEEAYNPNGNDWVLKTTTPDVNGDTDILESYKGNELQYHSSWDWLMPVTEKISDIKGWSLNSTLEWLSESQDRDGLYDIEGIFQAVVEFINQINKEKL